MKNLRFRISVVLFNMAARLWPLTGRFYGQSHYVGDRWLTWTLESDLKK
jgi:hypothetical protein